MNYRVRRQGQELGTFSLEELHTRRASGEFAGNEYVMCVGKFDWQPLDFLLQRGPEAMPPPLPPPPRPSIVPTVLWAIGILGVLSFLGLFAFGVYQGFTIARRAAGVSRRIQASSGSDSAMTAVTPLI